MRSVMEPLSVGPPAQSFKRGIPLRCCLAGNSRLRGHRYPCQLLTKKFTHSTRRLVTTSTSIPNLQQTHEEKANLEPYPNWGEFASRVSGEWDGFGAEFNGKGEPVELPDNVVPEAFKEWEVQVFDWQTQCPTLAETSSPSFFYNLIKLLPTVGCEADAATRHSTEKKTLQESLNFGYDRSGNYVAIWPKIGKFVDPFFEIEHCLRQPENHEVRVRIIQRVRKGERGLSVEKIEVFSEQWYGPFRNGEQLGGCSIRESGFAASAPIEKSRVLGNWERVSVGASFSDSEKNEVKELGGERREKMTRVGEGLMTLPKQLWSSTGTKDDDERWVEVGWMIDHGYAVTSRCVFSKNGDLKEISVGREAVILEDTTSM